MDNKAGVRTMSRVYLYLPESERPKVALKAKDMFLDGGKIMACNERFDRFVIRAKSGEEISVTPEVCTFSCDIKETL